MVDTTVMHNIVAEISVLRLGVGYQWTMATPAGDRVGHAVVRTPSEAVWRAVDSLRSEDGTLSGVLAIYSWDGHSVAYAPLWAVPTYELLEWRQIAVPVLINYEVTP